MGAGCALKLVNNFMKPLGFTVSVLKDTNAVIASSEVDLGSVREGSYLRIGNDTLFYQVARAEEFFYIKNCDCINKQTIRVNEDVGVNLLPGDTLDISFKEYGFDSFFGIINGGGGYAVGDILYLKTGKPSVNTTTGVTQATAFLVLAVNEAGSITEVGVHQEGKYIEPPENTSEVIGGTGGGAVFEVQHYLLDDRTIIERNIHNITKGIGYTDVTLVYPLPMIIDKAKFSVRKWRMILTSNYLGDDKFHETYQVARDFTPALHLPLLAKGSFNSELLLNKALSLIDAKCLEYENRIKELEAKFNQP